MRKWSISIFALTLIGLLMFSWALLTSPTHAQEEIPTPTPTDYEMPDYETPVPGSPQDGGGGIGDDGRVNPEQVEFYDVYCQNDEIHVWRGIPTGQLITSFSLAFVAASDPLGTMKDGVSLNRVGQLITLSGSNGNWAGPGTKTFTLDQCIAANGGLPTEPPPVPPPPPEDSSQDTFQEQLVAYYRCLGMGGDFSFGSGVCETFWDVVLEAIFGCWLQSMGIPIFGLTLYLGRKGVFARLKRRLQHRQRGDDANPH